MFGVSARLTYEEWHEAVTKKTAYVFQAKELRQKILEFGKVASKY